MSFLNLAWRVIAAVTVCVTGPAVMGQTYHPFADPMEFDPDWQFFAPVDVESLAELSPRKRSNVGWFGTYDRTYLWTSRPEVEDSRSQGDFGWGNRFDFGLMTEDDNGWLFSWRRMTGPNVYFETYQERFDRVNAADLGDPLAPFAPFTDANDPVLGTRGYVLSDSQNVIGFTNFEINKTWRREPYRYGGILEPMVGFKYSNLKDSSKNQTYTPDDVLFTETLVDHTTVVNNQMFGGQLGARYYTHYNRWTLSGEIRAFGLANFQDNTYVRNTFLTTYTGAAATGVGISNERHTSAIVSSSNTEFAFGFEARAQAAYQVTRSFNLRAGIDFVNFAKGIWRGANPGFGQVGLHDQDVQMSGISFGLAVNR
ncbi:MAG: hypothetical protein Aurels2KO_46920 [Aureliella sp.]